MSTPTDHLPEDSTAPDSKLKGGCSAMPGSAPESLTKFPPERLEQHRVAIAKAAKEGAYKSSAHSKAILQNLKKAQAAVRGTKRTEEFKQQVSTKMTGRKLSEKHIEAVAASQTGKPKVSSKIAKGVENVHSAEGAFRSPSNVVWQVVNISEFIRKRPDLFHPSDVVWKGKSCRALQGLASLVAPTKPRASWKGWTLVLCGLGPNDQVEARRQ